MLSGADVVKNHACAAEIVELSAMRGELKEERSMLADAVEALQVALADMADELDDAEAALEQAAAEYNLKGSVMAAALLEELDEQWREAEEQLTEVEERLAAVSLERRALERAMRSAHARIARS